MKHLFVLLVSLSAGPMISGAAAAPDSKPGLILKSETLWLGFDPARLALVSLKDPRTRHEFLESLPDSPILWALNMEDPDKKPFRVQSNMASKLEFKRSAKEGTVTLIWKGFEIAGEANAMDVKVIVRLPRDSDRSYWSIEVDNRSKSSLMDVQFPYIAGISKAAQPSAAIPRHNWGMMERNITATSGSYPSHFWPMQFLALLEKESGLYLAYEDPRATPKYFSLEPGKLFTFTNVVENASLPGNDYTSPGPAAIGVCGADWWKAAKMFRKWAIRQEWTKRGPLTRASSVPENAKNIGIWFCEGVGTEPADTCLPRLQAGSDYFGLPAAIQFYGWHRAAFDTEYPDYFPAQPHFLPVADGLTASGWMVAPYINGRLQDVAIPTGKEAASWMAKKKDGQPYAEEYGSGAKFAVMCPATTYWQNTMQEVAKRLLGEYHVNSIYFDQIGAADIALCYDPSHGHPLGGGGHWVEGYRKMLGGVKAMRTRKGEVPLITTENTTDCYMDVVDGFLTWTPRHPDEIPLLTAVYSGYSIYFGSNAQVDTSDGLASYAMFVGRDILWGTQPGWMPVDITSERGAYLRDVARLRYAGSKFFQFGELVGELKPHSDPGIVKGRWNNILRVENIPYDVSIPAVMSSIWKSAEGTLGVAIANLSGEEKTFSYTLTPNDYGLSLPKGSEWKLTKIEAEGRKAQGTVSDQSLEREEKLKPWEMRLIEIEPMK